MQVLNLNTLRSGFGCMQAWKLWSAGQALELMDPLLANTYEETEVLKCIQIGLLCVQEDPAKGLQFQV